MLAGYGQQLREKQKVKRIYFVLEKQFRNYFEKALRQKGVTGENLLFMLERRLDNAVYRSGFSTSRRQARQLVNHGHVTVNGRKVNIPSFQVKVGDVIAVKETSQKNAHVEGAWQTAVGRGRPAWLSAGEKDLSVTVTASPRRDAGGPLPQQPIRLQASGFRLQAFGLQAQAADARLQAADCGAKAGGCGLQGPALQRVSHALRVIIDGSP